MVQLPLSGHLSRGAVAGLRPQRVAESYGSMGRALISEDRLLAVTEDADDAVMVVADASDVTTTLSA